MKELPLSIAKTHFSSLLKEVAAGAEIAISYGKKKQTIAVIVPFEKYKKTKTRELGTLSERGEVEFSEDFSMTDEELLHS